MVADGIVGAGCTLHIFREPYFNVEMIIRSVHHLYGPTICPMHSIIQSVQAAYMQDVTVLMLKSIVLTL